MLFSVHIIRNNTYCEIFNKCVICRFGPLVWRSSKERKKRSRALRNAKCNSGDSGIQLEVIIIF